MNDGFCFDWLVMNLQPIKTLKNNLSINLPWNYLYEIGPLCQQKNWSTRQCEKFDPTINIIIISCSFFLRSPNFFGGRGGAFSRNGPLLLGNSIFLGNSVLRRRLKFIAKKVCSCILKSWISSDQSQPVWPDWAIFWTLGNFLKPLATINLPKSPTFLGKFWKVVKIYHFSSEIILGQLLLTFGDFFWSHWRYVTAFVQHLPSNNEIICSRACRVLQI